MFYKFRQGIKNLYKYFKVVWNDQDWDSEFIYDLLEVKLKNMQKYFASDKPVSASAEKDAENIEYALYLLNRLRDEEGIHNEAFYDFDITYPDFELKISSEPCEDNPGYRRLIFNETEGQRWLRSKCYRKQYELEQQRHNEFWNFIRDHIQQWWD